MFKFRQLFQIQRDLSSVKAEDLSNVLYVSPHFVNVGEQLDIFGWDQKIITMLIRKEIFKTMRVTTMSRHYSLRALKTNPNVVQIKKHICGQTERDQAVVWANNFFT